MTAMAATIAHTHTALPHRQSVWDVFEKKRSPPQRENGPHPLSMIPMLCGVCGTVELIAYDHKETEREEGESKLYLLVILDQCQAVSTS